MRIGVDGGCLSNRRGFGRFARELLAAVGRVETRHELTVYIDRPSLGDPILDLPAGLRVVPVEVGEAPSRAASASGRRSLRDLMAMSRAVANDRPDVIFFPASYSFFPVWNVRRVVVTIFDALPLEHPELVFPNRRGRLFWRLKERAAVASADRILTTSEASRRDLMRWYRLRPDRVGLIGAAADPAFRPTEACPKSDDSLRRHGLEPGDRYLIYVGGLSPHKNLPRLVEAFARGAAGGDRLVLVGDFGDVFHTHLPEIRAAIERTGIGPRVVMPGFVPDEDLVHLYGRAVALIQPSLMEGFGLPPVEAMACGTPVISSTAGSLPEVVGDAGRYFEPTDVDGMAGAISAVMRDPAERARLARLAAGRATRFTWDGAARQLLGELTREDEWALGGPDSARGAA